MAKYVGMMVPKWQNKHTIHYRTKSKKKHTRKKRCRTPLEWIHRDPRGGSGVMTKHIVWVDLAKTQGPLNKLKDLGEQPRAWRKLKHLRWKLSGSWWRLVKTWIGGWGERVSVAQPGNCCVSPVRVGVRVMRAEVVWGHVHIPERGPKTGRVNVRSNFALIYRSKQISFKQAMGQLDVIKVMDKKN